MLLRTAAHRVLYSVYRIPLATFQRIVQAEQYNNRPDNAGEALSLFIQLFILKPFSQVSLRTFVKSGKGFDDKALRLFKIGDHPVGDDRKASV